MPPEVPSEMTPCDLLLWQVTGKHSGWQEVDMAYIRA